MGRGKNHQTFDTSVDQFNFTMNTTECPRGRRGPPRIAEETHELIDSVYLVASPILFALTAVGLVLGVFTLLRPRIRCHSSAIYLIVLFFLDMSTILAEFTDDFIGALSDEKRGRRWSIENQVMRFFKVFNRPTAGLVVTALALERVAILANPKRFSRIVGSIQYMIVAFTTILVISATTAGLLIRDPNYKPGYATAFHRGCSASTNEQRPWFKEKRHVIVWKQVLDYGETALQTIFLIILGGLILRKRLARRQDPVNSAVAAARRAAVQFNRINLIVFAMTLTSVIQMVNGVLSTKLFYDARKERVDKSVTVISLKIVAHSFVAIRFFLLLLLSPKFRMECKQLITCTGLRNNSTASYIDKNGKRRKVDINPTANSISRRISFQLRKQQSRKSDSTGSLDSLPVDSEKTRKPELESIEEEV